MILIFTLMIQAVPQLCSKNLDENFQLSVPNTYLRITYQLFEQANNNIINKTMIQIISKQKETISFSYSNNMFQIYINNSSELQNIALIPGQYISYEIFCPDYQRNACNFQSKIYRWNEIQFKICLDQDFVDQIYDEIAQQNYLSQLIIENIDNSLFHTSMWIKEIVLGNLPIQIIFRQPQGCIFKFNLKTKRIIYCSLKSESYLIIKESMYFNVWFYFEFNQFQYKQEFNSFFILGQFQIERTKSFNTQINYSFENKLQLEYPNSIISSFKIKQSYETEIQMNLCMPDCKLCELGQCIECKNSLILESGICYCSNIDQVSDQDGICQYPANLLQLKEIESNSKCNFGYYYLDIILGCVQCPFEDNLPEINCMLGLSQNETNNQITLKRNFEQKFRNQLQKVIYKFRCPKYCLSCIIIDKTIQCSLCKQGQLDYKGLCRLCKIKNCQYCFTLVRETCLVCFEFYSLNQHQQCIQSQEYQFDKLLLHLQTLFKQGDEICQLSDSNRCILCEEGLLIQNGICVQSQKINILYDSNSIFAKDPLISFGFKQQGNLYYKNLELLNSQKLYFEQSIKSKIFIDQYSSDTFTPSYYNKEIKKYSFCKKFHNCDNQLEIDVKIIKTNDGISLLFEQILFQDINQILLKLQLYDISLKLIQINIISDLKLFVGINMVSKILKIDPKNKFIVQLFYSGGNIFNDLCDMDFQINISNPQTLYINDVNFFNQQPQQLVINFDNDEILIKNANIQGNISFIFQNQTKVTIQLIKLSQNNINTEFIFKFLCKNVQILLENLYIYDLKIINTTIFFIQSEITSLVFKNSIFYNITLNSSSIIYQGLNISQLNMQDLCYSQIFFDDLEFNELKFENSQLFQQHVSYFSIQNQVLIKNNIITKSIMNNSDLYQFFGQHYQMFTIDTIFITHIQSYHSTFFYINYQHENQLILNNISLINCQIKNKFFIYISAANQVLIKGLFIQQLVLQSSQFALIIVMTKNAYLRNFNLINQYGNIIAKSLILISAQDIQIKDFTIFSQSINLIQLQRGFFLQTFSQINLINLNISNINFFGDSFLTIQSTSQNLILMKGLEFRITLLSYTQQLDNDRQMLIQFQSQQSFSVYANDLNFQLNYQESQYRRRSVIYSTGQSNIKLNNMTFTIRDNESIPNSLIYVEGNVIEVTNVFIQYVSYKYIQDMVKQSNYIFHLFSKILHLQFIYLDVNSSQFGIIHFIPNYYLGDLIQISNITVISGSYIDSFLTAPSGIHNLIILQNIQIVASINTCFISVFLPQNTKFIIKNMTLIQQNSRNINAININGNSKLFVNLINMHVSKIVSKQQMDQQYSSEVYLRISVRYLYLDSFIIKQLDQPAIKIAANQIFLKNFMISNVKSIEDIIFIGESSRILIRETLVLYSQSKRSIININQNYCKQLFIRNIKFVENIIQNGSLIDLDAGNQRNDSTNNLKNIKLVLYNMQSIKNICNICYKFITNINYNIYLQIKNTFQVDNIANQVFEIQNLSTIVSGSFIKQGFTTFDQSLIQSNRQVLFYNTLIILYEGIMTLSTNYSRIVYINSKVEAYQNYNDILVWHNKLFPTILKLSINKLSEEIQLQINEISQNFKVFSVSNQMNFPSGMRSNGYRILMLDQKQYLPYQDHIYVYGHDEYNNIKLYIKKCELSTDNNNIIMIPSYINSTLLLSDVVFIGNPYLIENFTLQINCQYDEMQLQLVIKSKLFKCQLGEILIKNKCKQCNIEYNLYSVKKHSQKCKLIDYGKIEDVQIGLIKLKQGYWRPYYSNDQIEHCQLNNCLGGWDVDFNSCFRGYIGPLCSECDNNNIRGDGYYSKYRQQCFECQNEVNYIYNILYIVIVSLISLAITTRSQYLICQRYQILICQNKYYQILNKLSIDQISVLIKQIQNYFFYLQFVNMIFGVDLNLGVIVNTVSNPIQILNPQYDCLISHFELNQQIIKLIIQIITPICILIIFYVIIIMINRYVKFKYFYVFIYTPILQFFILYQIVICQSAISHLTYIKISGIKWIYGAKQYQYFESTNVYLFIVLSIAIFIFAIIIPSLFVLILYKKQAILQSKVVLYKIGYLYQEYTNNKYYWEFLKMTIKVCYLAFSFALINNFTLLVPISTLFFVYIIQLLKYQKPYYLQNLNQYDQQFHLLLVINLLIFGITQHYHQVNIKNILIILFYLINIIYFYRIIKIIIVKTYYNNPQIFDKIRSQFLKANSKSLDETKKDVSIKYNLLKSYAKAQTSQIINSRICNSKSDRNRPQTRNLILLNMRSNQPNQELELVTFN